MSKQSCKYPYSISGYIKKTRFQRESLEYPWCFVAIDNQISHYYNWYCRKAFRGWQLPLNGCHVTCIAGPKESNPVSQEKVNPFTRLDITINYSPTVYTNGRAFWLKCISSDLDRMRYLIGLPKKKFGYHITLGNWKNGFNLY